MLSCWYWYCLFGWIIFLCFLLQIWSVIRQSKLEHSEGFLDLLSLCFYVYIKMCFSASSAIHNKTPAHAATTSKRTKTPKTTNQKGKTVRWSWNQKGSSANPAFWWLQIVDLRSIWRGHIVVWLIIYYIL